MHSHAPYPRPKRYPAMRWSSCHPFLSCERKTQGLLLRGSLRAAAASRHGHGHGHARNIECIPVVTKQELGGDQVPYNLVLEPCYLTGSDFRSDMDYDEFVRNTKLPQYCLAVGPYAKEQPLTGELRRCTYQGEVWFRTTVVCHS